MWTRKSFIKEASQWYASEWHKRESSARGTKLSKSTKSSSAFCDVHSASCGLIPLERQFDGRRRDVQQFDRLSRERADASAGQDDAGDVERIGGGDLQRHVRRCAAYRPQQVHGFGPRELFAEKPRHETAAPDFAASFHTAERHQQVTPRGSEGLAGEKVSKNHSPSQQKLAGKDVSPFIGRRRGMRKIQQCPASGSMPGHLQPRTALAAPAFWVDQGAQVLETVGCDKSRSGKFPERILNLARELARGLDQFR